jgi:hypothetical protein
VKREVDTLDATPSKRLFLSIIADYNLNRAICELVDNAFDIWTYDGRSGLLNVKIKLDTEQQTIRIMDNAGGVRESDLNSLVAPGQTLKGPEEETIGIFGVGTKRAVVALAQDVKITTRYGGAKTFRVEIDDDWLQSEDWELAYYEVEDIEKGTTLIELQSLRIKLTDGSINALKKHLGATYAKFLENKKAIVTVNGALIIGENFDNWAYPPKYEPRSYNGTLTTDGGNHIKISMTGGLARESSPATGEFGVYIYCNDRLIARGLKNYDVGFVKGLAGLPHPKLSLVKVIVSLTGAAQSMPWNSSKSGIAPNHKVFVEVRPRLVELVAHYASLSRRFQGHWPERVFRYKSGNIVNISIPDFPDLTSLHLPPLPKSRPRYGDLVKQGNSQLAKKKPWTVGLFESIIAVDMIFKQKLEQKNRICVIILDSTLEIAFKEFLVNESKRPFNDQRLSQIFARRESVHEAIKEFTSISEETWKKIAHYYRLRSKLVHERASVSITDSEVRDYRELVHSVLSDLFGDIVL